MEKLNLQFIYLNALKMKNVVKYHGILQLEFVLIIFVNLLEVKNANQMPTAIAKLVILIIFAKIKKSMKNVQMIGNVVKNVFAYSTQQTVKLQMKKLVDLLLN